MIDLIPEVNQYNGQFDNFSFFDFIRGVKREKIEQRIHYAEYGDTDEHYLIDVTDSTDSNTQINVHFDFTKRYFHF